MATVVRVLKKKLFASSTRALGDLVLPSSSWRWYSSNPVVAVGDETIAPLSSSFSRQSPWMMLPSKFDGADKSCYSFYSLAEKRIIEVNKQSKSRSRSRSSLHKDDMGAAPDDNARCVGSSHGWLALINPRDCALFLSNPISLQNIRLLPIQTLPCISSGRLQFSAYTPQHWSKYIIDKLILSSSPEPDGNDHCRVMVIDGFNDALAFCRPGDTTWTALDGPLKYFVQIAYSSKRQLFYGVTRYEEFEAWDLRDSSAPVRYPIDNVKQDSPFVLKTLEEKLWFQMCCNVHSHIAVDQSSGEVLYIRRFSAHIAKDGTSFLGSVTCKRPLKTIDFLVYKLIFGKIVVAKYLECLDDRALFIGINHSLCLSARDFPELRPNSIYFTDDDPSMCHPPYRGQDMGVYNLEDNSFAPFCPIDLTKIKSPTVWFTPNQYHGSSLH